MTKVGDFGLEGLLETENFGFEVFVFVGFDLAEDGFVFVGEGFEGGLDFVLEFFAKTGFEFFLAGVEVGLGVVEVGNFGHVGVDGGLELVLELNSGLLNHLLVVGEKLVEL